MSLLNKLHSLPLAGLAGFAVTGLWGCLLISAAKAAGDSPWYYAQRQLFSLAVGCLGFAVCASVPFRRIMKQRFFWGGLLFVLLLLVLVCGVRMNGMRGWFNLTDYFQFQPSEFAKPVFLLLLAGYAGNLRIPEWKRILLLAGCSLCFILPVMAEPDFGTALIFFCGFLFVVWCGGISKKYLIPAITALGVGTAGFLALHPYARWRLLAWFNPASGVRGTWHIRQFRYAMAEGGLAGSEHGRALWSNAYLPLPHSDSLYASIVETGGLIGGLIVLIAFCVIAWAFLRISQNERLPFYARIFIASVALTYLTQALIHIGVNVILLPPTGITLPFLSYGGSSLCSTMIAYGLAFSASKSERAG